MILDVVRSDTLHAHLLGPWLRQADRVELLAGSGETPTAALLRGLEVSDECWTVLAPEGPICIFGVCALGPGLAAVWLLGSDGIVKHYREFARRSKIIMQEIADYYGVLTNLVHPDNAVHLRWLQWLGAELGEPTAHPVSGEPFIPFAYDPHV